MRSEAIRVIIGFLKRLILVEFVAVAVYMAAAALGYYAQIYRELGLGGFLSFQIAQALFLFMGQSIIIAVLFWRWRRRLLADQPQELATLPEHEKLERKATLRWDMAAGKVNKSLERATMKTVAAFLNTNGGKLLIGVADDGAIVGMEHDYATLARKDADGLANHFGNLFNAMLGAHVRHLVTVRPVAIQDRECMLVSVASSGRPVYLSDDGKEEFFVRTGNSTTSLKLSEAAAYIQSRWRVSS